MRASADEAIVRVALLDPTACGVNVTPNVHDDSAPSAVPEHVSCEMA